MRGRIAPGRLAAGAPREQEAPDDGRVERQRRGLKVAQGNALGPRSP